MDLKRPREVYGIFLGLGEWPECPGKSRSPEMNGAWRRSRPRRRSWPAGEEALGGRGGGPGRPGRRRLGGSGEASWRGRILLPGASVGGTTLVAPNGPKRSQNRRFPEGAGPAPRPESQPPPEHGDWLHGTRFRVLLRATLLPDGCPVGVRRQVWTAQGGLKPP